MLTNVCYIYIMTKLEFINRYGIDKYNLLLQQKAKRQKERRKDKDYYNKHIEYNRNRLYSKYVLNKNIELIENYELAKADNFIGWDIHHKDEIRLLPSGMIALRTMEELIENGRYYNCPANELMFMKHSEHSALHRNYTI